eukprot:m.608247 g.608247  ORF g.608247 m.608247 type:complete len:66 (-) comp22484_c2_seq18:20-217(-)
MDCTALFKSSLPVHPLLCIPIDRCCEHMHQVRHFDTALLVQTPLAVKLRHYSALIGTVRGAIQAW